MSIRSRPKRHRDSKLNWKASSIKLLRLYSEKSSPLFSYPIKILYTRQCPHCSILKLRDNYEHCRSWVCSFRMYSSDAEITRIYIVNLKKQYLPFRYCRQQNWKVHEELYGAWENRKICMIEIVWELGQKLAIIIDGGEGDSFCTS